MPDEASKDVPAGPQESREISREALTGSGAFEKRADVFPVAQAEVVPLDQIMNGPGPMMAAPASSGDASAGDGSGASGGGDSSGE